VIRTYKGAVTTLCRQAGQADFAWQRNYYEHVIRNEDELNRARQYIIDNPQNWSSDADNPAHM
jgi:putative transposase